MVLACARPETGPDGFEASCTVVRDGDSLVVESAGEPVEIRLEGIDAPERGDPYSRKARAALADLVLGETVLVRPKERDRYGRTVARVLAGEVDVSVALVEQGLAWHYTRYSLDPVLADAEQGARTAKRNLWSLPDPVPPWERRAARRGERRTRSTSSEEAARP